MTRASLRFLALLGLAMGLSACGTHRRPAVTGPGGGARSNPGGATTPVQPVDSGPDVGSLGNDAPTSYDVAPDSGEGGPLTDIHFDYNKATIDDAARSILEKNAGWLQNHREQKVRVEGHCDERGTVEYNLALGEQRAKAARDYLATLGVAAERLSTVSYGKERPIDSGHDEVAFRKNRRAHFAVAP